MELLNLGFGELIAVMVATSAILVALYSRAQRRRIVPVSTLRFWGTATGARKRTRWTRIQNPWSLLLTLASLFCLLIAIARPEFTSGQRPRNNLLLIDVSSASAFRMGSGTVLDEEKRVAERYLDRVSAGDRVLVAGTDDSVFPVSSLGRNDARARAALRSLHSGIAAWDAITAFSLADHLRRATSGEPGEIVYVGPARTERVSAQIPRNVRVLQVKSSAEDLGIAALEASSEQGNKWRVRALIRNYGTRDGSFTVSSPMGERVLHLRAGEESRIEEAAPGGRSYNLVLSASDPYGADDRASLQLPNSGSLNLLLLTNRCHDLERAFSSMPGIRTTCSAPDSFGPVASADITISDGFVPAHSPVPTICIMPSGVKTPVTTTVSNWGVDGVTDGDYRIEQRAAIVAGPNDRILAATPRGPVVLIPTGAGSPEALFAFDPFAGGAGTSGTTPLLLAGVLRALVPSWPLAPIKAKLPEVAASRWTPNGNVTYGLPFQREWSGEVQRWKVFAIIGALGLLLEWLLFARSAGLVTALRFAALATVAIAVFAPLTVQIKRHALATAILVDESGSLTEQQRASTRSAADHLARSYGPAVQTLPFGSASRTSLEEALITGASILPEDKAKHLVLFSDGRETTGSAERAARHLAGQHIAVDTVLVPQTSRRDLQILSISTPTSAYAGSPVGLNVNVQSPSDSGGYLALSVGGRVLAREPVHLQTGNQTLHVSVKINQSGVMLVTCQLRTPRSAATLSRAISLLEANATVVATDRMEAEGPIVRAMRSAGLKVRFVETSAFTGSGPSQFVALDNVNLTDLSAGAARSLVEYVRKGGGLLVLGGEQQQYRDARDENALDAILPARLAPPEAPAGIAVVLVIDKSSSMEGRKIELARLSSEAVVDHLRNEDQIGVLMFDNSFQWVVPMRPAANKIAIKRMIGSIVADGGTQIAPALAEGYRRLLRSQAPVKHIILLTDGISEEGDSIQLAKEALFHGVTVSTVGLGMDVNRSYLDHLASSSGGMSYLLHTPENLRDVLLKDIEDFSGKTVVEQRFTPVVLRDSELLRGTGLDKAPPLEGYARYQAKPNADTLLTIGERKDPLYVEWQYGLGRVAVFASDAKDRWAKQWLTWSGFDTFWENAVRRLIGEPGASPVRARFNAKRDEIVVQRDGDAVRGTWYLTGSDGLFQRVVFDSDGLFRFPLAERSGLFCIKSSDLSEPEAGVYVPADDTGNANGPELMQQIATITGGHHHTGVPESVGTSSDVVTLPWEPWPFLLAIAVLVTMIEIGLRPRSRDTATIHVVA